MSITTRRVLLTSLFVDCLDVGTNLVTYLLTGSAVIFAELVQGMIDFTGSLFLVIGRSQARKPRDYLHPFGYARDIFFWSLLSSIIMLFVGSTLAILQGYRHFVTPHLLHYKELGIIILVISVITNGYSFFLGVKKLYIPGINFLQNFQESSQQLVKTAVIRDLLGILAAVIGLVAFIIYQLTASAIVDGLGAILIGLLLIIFSLMLINQSRHLLVGHAVPKKVIHRIRRSALTISEVIDINRLVAVYIGSDQILVDLDVALKSHLSTRQIEEVLDRIKETIIHDVPESQSVQIDLNSPKLRERVTIEKV